MSTQAARSIRFTHTSPQQAFRLFELTPEILELITSENAPTLYLKSRRTDNITSTTGQDTGSNNAFVNLCTPDQTYRIRQVQSSNSIHIIETSDNQNEVIPLIKQQQNEELLGVPETVTAIAKCGSTLELHALKTEESLPLAKRMLAQLLRVYDELSTEKDLANHDDDEDVVMSESDDRGLISYQPIQVKNAIFDDLPYARSQCEAAWVELCAFVSRDAAMGVACQPSARVRLELWKRLMEGCILQGIDVEKQFLVRDLWKAVLGQDTDNEKMFSRPLFNAVVRRLSEGSGKSISESESDLKWSNMDKDVCIQWTSETYLEAIAPTEKLAIGRSEFLNAWKDLLPETWRNEVSLNQLPEASYKHPDPVSICFVRDADREKMKREAKDSSGNGAKAKVSRNWHERLKSQKK